MFRLALLSLACLAATLTLAQEKGVTALRPPSPLPAAAPERPATVSMDLPVYIGTTGFAWGGIYTGRSGATRSRWSLVPRIAGFPGDFLFHHGPAGNFFLLGGASVFSSRTPFLSGFGIRRGFVLRRRH